MRKSVYICIDDCISIQLQFQKLFEECIALLDY